MSETTAKCQHCGNLYKQYMYMVGDQSACPSCVAKAESNMNPTIHRFDNLINSGTGKPISVDIDKALNLAHRDSAKTIAKGKLRDARQGFDDLLDNIEDLEPEYSQVITDNFWELI